MSNTPYTPSPIVEIAIENYLTAIDNLANAISSDDNVRVVTLCGSVRFKKLYEVINFRLSLKNICVFGLASFGDNTLGGNITEEQKIILDATHKHKICHSDGVVIIDPNKYIGQSTKSEIEYTQERHREDAKIFYLSDYMD
jgi:hypothetical protein